MIDQYSTKTVQTKVVATVKIGWLCGCKAVHLINDEWLPIFTCQRHRRHRP